MTGPREDHVKAVRRPAALLAAMTLSVGALSACGGDDPDGDGSSTTTATPLDPSSSSSSSSGSESSSSSSSSGSGSSTSASAKGDAPELPAAAKEHTAEGATAFAEFYWTEQSRAVHVGDTSTLKTLVAEDCKVCDQYIGSVDAEIAKGRHADVLPTTIKSVRANSSTDGRSERAATVVAKDRAYSLVDAKGKSDLAPTEPVNYRVIIYMDWQGGSWKVVDSYMLT